MNPLIKQSCASVFSLAFSVTTFSAYAAHIPDNITLAPAKEQTLVRGNDAEAATLDPMKAEGLAEMHIIRDLFEGLVIQDENGHIIPGVASNWVVQDNKVYTFTLRQDAKWSNGQPITADDFVYSLRRLADPKSASPNAWYLKLAQIENAEAIVDGKKPVDSLGVKAIDPHTLQITLSKPVPYFIAMTAHTAMMPVPKSVIEKYGDRWARAGHIVSNGAYTLKKWVVNERIELTRNPNYWDDKDTVINKVVYIPFENQNSAMNRYLTGEVDITSDVPAAMAPKLKKEHADAYTVTPLLCTYYYAFNTQHQPFDNPKVRQALSYAIHRDVITDGITQVGNIPAYTFAHKDVAGFKATQPKYAQMTQKERDEKAQALMKEAGFDKQHPLKGTLLYNTSATNKEIAVAITSMWNKTLGTDITLENQEWKSYLSSRKQGNFDIMRASWCGDYNEASTFLSLYTAGNERNYAFYSNPTYDAVMNRAQVATDLGERNHNYDQAESMLSQDMPIAPIYYYMQARLVRPTVGGFPMHNAEGKIYTKDLYIKAKKPKS
ncbi:oligopeptide ABC transporter substrate-binding protein OppA [Vibrio sp. CAIM 722]|uniref:Oligopeptide ABC transporter substrate-binding protein OppA n=1 Tax=Vibrio eleionomae TaxID=2653505 RepID=A0A7X4RVG7_9VIBR|nr:peptide ABC transporter substrate-binding protein [Vibrio eleionomae]MZI94134.1 oligopeptide ABC transporter substrate-binding protein OppA [Vibrio eleionomae]